MFITNGLLKARWMAVVVLLSFSLLLSGCTTTPEESGNGDGNENEVQNDAPLTTEEILETLGDTLSMPKEFTYRKFRADGGYMGSGLDVAYETPRVVTDPENVVIRCYYGFTLPKNGGFESFDQIVEYYTRRYDAFYETAYMYIVDSSDNTLIEATDENLISEKYAVYYEDDPTYSEDLGYVKLTYSHCVDVKVPSSYFKKNTGWFDVCVFSDNTLSPYDRPPTPDDDGGNPIIRFRVCYGRLDDGRIILFTSNEFIKYHEALFYN